MELHRFTVYRCVITSQVMCIFRYFSTGTENSTVNDFRKIPFKGYSPQALSLITEAFLILQIYFSN